MNIFNVVELKILKKMKVISNTIGYSGISQSHLSFRPRILREFQKTLKIKPGRNHPKNFTFFFVLVEVMRC